MDGWTDGQMERQTGRQISVTPEYNLFNVAYLILRRILKILRLLRKD